MAEIREACDAEMKLRIDARKRAGYVIWKQRIEGMSENDRRRLRLLEESMALAGLCSDGDTWKLIDNDDDAPADGQSKRNRDLVAGLISSIGQAAP